MMKFSLFFKSLLFSIVIALFTTAGIASDFSTVPTDPQIVTGKLDNGLTYYIKRNNYPAQHVDFFIAQKVGSIQEEENQRGLAHFLEHMCFNGTRHFPGNSIITYMESVGVKFGANLNAYTSTDETVYNICNVPSERRSVLDTCFLVLSDWSHDLLLNGKDIDEERGVIEGEWRMRSGANYRLLEQAAPVIYPNCLYGRRMPIGTMDVVRNFKHDELRDYYRRWYHPSNQAIIVVGDIDPDYAVAKIHELFGKIANPADAPAVTAVEVPDNERIISVVATDREQTQTTVRLFFKHDDLPAELMPTTAFLRRQYLNSVVTSMLNNRLDELKQEPDAPFTSARAADRDFMISKTRQAFQLTAVAKDGKAMPTIMSLEREVNRALQHGFTEGEYNRARLNFESAVNKLYRERDKYSNTSYARDFVRAFIDGEPLPSIEQYRDAMQDIIDGITLNDVNNHYRSLVSTDDRNVVIVTYAPDDKSDNLPTDLDMAEAFKLARHQEVAAYVDRDKPHQLMTTLPQAGTIVSEQAVPEYDAMRWTLSNGINVYVSHTDLNPDEIIIAGTQRGGMSNNYTPANAPSIKAINQVMAVSAVGEFTQTDLKKVLAGKNVKMRTFVSKTEQGFQGTTTPADIETEFQLLYLKLTAAGRDEKAFNQFIESNRQRLANQSSDPKYEFADSLFAGVFNHHPLSAEKLQAAEVDRVDYDVILDTYRDRFADCGTMNVFIVGAYDETQLRDLVCRYIASLPAAGRDEQPVDIGYRLFDRDVVTEWTRAMENPQDKVYFFWTNECPYNLRNNMLAKITGQIMHDRFLKMIREERGWTYHVDSHCSVVSDINGNDPSVIYFPLNVTVTAGKAGETRQLIRDEMRNVISNGVTDDELNSVRQYLRKVHGEDIQDNSYRMAMMAAQVKHGQNFDAAYIETLDAITTDDIRDFLRDYIATGHHLELQMTPQ